MTWMILPPDSSMEGWDVRMDKESLDLTNVD